MIFLMFKIKINKQIFFNNLNIKSIINSEIILNKYSTTLFESLINYYFPYKLQKNQ